MLKKTILALAFAATACDEPDPNAPYRYLEVPPPVWAQQMRVTVNQAGAAVVTPRGDYFFIWRGTDIGDGLYAMRQRYNLNVRDRSGTECNWDASERLTRCWKPNPAYDAYMKARQPQPGTN